MADRRGVALVLLILLSASAVAGLAGYRMHIQDVWHHTAEPVNATVQVDFPDDTTFRVNVTVQGSHANALSALYAAGELGGFGVGVRETSYGVFVHTIGEFRSQAGTMCGWLYSIDGKGDAYQPNHAADREHLVEGTQVYWYWDCI